MTGLRDIQEPPLPLDEENFKGCLTFVGDQLTYYINRRCRADLLWSFWFNCAKSAFGEDPSLTNDFYERLTDQSHWIGYSETMVIPSSDSVKVLRAKKFPRGYKRNAERLDFHVTKPEFAKAFRVIRQLGRKRKGVIVREGRIFQCVRVVLLDDEQFGEKTVDDGVRNFKKLRSECDAEMLGEYAAFVDAAQSEWVYFVRACAHMHVLTSAAQVKEYRDYCASAGGAPPVGEEASPDWLLSESCRERVLDAFNRAVAQFESEI
ncbi:MAG: hypothetical protein JWQ02_938 [Capsulimonas sp.]|nr:hypothetical protein [Capsulimonas sp.]